MWPDQLDGARLVASVVSKPVDQERDAQVGSGAPEEREAADGMRRWRASAQEILEICHMTTMYCHGCAAKNGWLPVAPSNLTGSAYQLDKFAKHTSPPSAESFIVSIFNDSSYEAYAQYCVDTVISGCVEVDGQGRRNIVWVATREVGSLFVGGVLQGGVDTVKLVLPHDPAKVHLYPTSSAEIVSSKCTECGAAIAY